MSRADLQVRGFYSLCWRQTPSTFNEANSKLLSTRDPDSNQFRYLKKCLCCVNRPHPSPILIPSLRLPFPPFSWNPSLPFPHPHKQPSPSLPSFLPPSLPPSLPPLSPPSLPPFLSSSLPSAFPPSCLGPFLLPSYLPLLIS